MIPDYYSNHYKQYHDKTFYVDSAGYLLPFAENLETGAHVLDIGCGSGRDLLWLSKKGFRATGFEGSSGLAALARQNTGCKVIEGDFETFDFSTLQAEALLLAGALLHLPHERVELALGNILHALRTETEAIIYLSLKEGSGVFTDAHNRPFYLWQDKEVRSVLHSTGLKVINFSRTPSVLGTGETWIGYVLKKKGLK